MTQIKINDMELGPAGDGSREGEGAGEGAVFYRCQRCGNCCRWPGDVCLEDGETAAIAEFLGMPEDEFIQDHTRLRANRTGLSLGEKPGGSCEFLDGLNRCRINEVKPLQCRGFPNSWNFPGWREVCEALSEGRDPLNGDRGLRGTRCDQDKHPG